MKSVTDILEQQRAYFRTGATLPATFRQEQLNRLGVAIEAREAEILAALHTDLGKGEFEGFASEIGFVYDEIRFNRKHLRRWMRPRRVPTPVVHTFASSTIHYRPHGVSAILAPWNYPFQLALAPVVAAIAAGNCVILKPSEVAASTAEVVAQLVQETFEEQHIAVVTGGPEVARELTSLPVDHIFFTGSTALGKEVMRAAAQNLIPVTLELGGKSPAVVSEQANIPIAARRIVWGKFLNAGQTCVAPDYICVHRSRKEELQAHIQETIAKWFAPDPGISEDYGRIISDRHFDRLQTILEHQNNAGRDTIYMGSAPRREDRYLPPTLCPGATFDDPVMEDELFGPILPVLEYTEMGALVEEIARRPTPLAAYLFSEDRREHDHFLRYLPFGGATINDTLVHLTNPHLPFGGSGPSGHGSYHGEAGFRAFSHGASVMRRSTRFDPPVKYPPYKDRIRLIRRIMHR